MEEDIRFNHLEISGSGDLQELENFRMRAKTIRRALSLAKLYPEPTRCPSDIKDWREENWGTPQHIRKATLDFVSPDSLVYSFLSVDSAPVTWVKKVSRDYPNLHFCLSSFDFIIKVGSTRVFQNGEEI